MTGRFPRICCVSLMFWIGSAATAQQGADKQQQWVTRTLQLAHVDAESVAKALKQLKLGVAVANVGSSTIVLRGSEENVKEAIVHVVSALDMPSQAEGSRTEVIPLAKSLPGSLGGLLNAVIPRGASSRYAIDHENRLLVVNAAEHQLDVIRDLVKQVDQQAKTLDLEFFFLRGSIGTFATEPGANLPASLKPVGKVLASNGVGQLSLLAPVSVVVDDRRRFESRASRNHVAEDDEEHLEFRVEGVTWLQPNEELVQLDLKAEVGGGFRTGAMDGKTAFTVETSIAAKVGHYVILTSGPGTTATGDAIALAVRVKVRS